MPVTWLPTAARDNFVTPVVRAKPQPRESLSVNQTWTAKADSGVFPDPTFNTQPAQLSFLAAGPQSTRPVVAPMAARPLTTDV